MKPAPNNLQALVQSHIKRFNYKPSQAYKGITSRENNQIVQCHERSMAGVLTQLCHFQNNNTLPIIVVCVVIASLNCRVRSKCDAYKMKQKSQFTYDTYY